MRFDIRVKQELVNEEMNEIVKSEFSEKEKIDSIVLKKVCVRSKICLHNAKISLKLFICLKVKNNEQIMIQCEMFNHSVSEVRNE